MELRDYYEYEKELSEVSGEEPDDVWIWQTFTDYLTDKRYIDVPILDKDKSEIGFFIVGKNVRPKGKFDYYIAETYVRPKYRRYGYAKKTVCDFIRSHPGKYTLHIINNNMKAKRFWHSVEIELQLKPIEIKHPLDGEKCSEYGFST